MTHDPEAAFQDADLELAEMAAAADAAERARRRGVCQHSSAVGYAGAVLYPEQEGLRAGQVACREHTGGCAAVFPSDAAWWAAMEEARA